MPPDAREPERLASLVAGEGSRAVLVHGFTQDARCWGPFADSLVAEGWQLVAVDAPGHGRSGSIRADIERGAHLVGDVGRRAVYIGYSMGGRLALRLALDRPDLVRALVLIGASPGIEAPGERAARRGADDALADRLEAIGVETFVDEWLRQPLFTSLPEQHAYRAERVANDAEGLASSLRLAGTGAMAPMWSRLHEIRVPVLMVTGERDQKFTALARRMAEVLSPNGWVVEVPEAGHSVHLEQPAPTAHVVTSWLRGVGLGSG